jgi:hypothetical protein
MIYRNIRLTTKQTVLHHALLLVRNSTVLCEVNIRSADQEMHRMLWNLINRQEIFILRQINRVHTLLL